MTGPAVSEAFCAETPRGFKHPATVGLDPCKCHGLAFCAGHHADQPAASGESGPVTTCHRDCQGTWPAGHAYHVRGCPNDPSHSGESGPVTP